MSLTELRPVLQALPREEKFQLLQELLAELAQQEELTKLGVVLEQEYEVRLPDHSDDAATHLSSLLAEERTGTR